MDSHTKKFENTENKIIKVVIYLLSIGKKNQLSFSLICQETNLSRTTLYSHFQSIDEIFDKINLEFKKEIETLQLKENKESKIENKLSILLNFIESNKELINAVRLISSEENQVLFNKLIINTIHFDNNTTINDRFLLYGSFGVIIEWIKPNSKISKKDVYNILIKHYNT